MDAGLNFNIHPPVDNKCVCRATWVLGEDGGGAEDDTVGVPPGHGQVS